MKITFTMLSLTLLIFVMISDAEGFDWADSWKIKNWESDAYCQTDTKVCTAKNKKGKCIKYDYERLPKKHVGIDKSAKEGDYVYITSDLYFVAKHEYSGGWKTGIFMQKNNNSTAPNNTYSVLHLKDVPQFREGENLKNKCVGRVANTPGGAHLHISYRKASYYSDTTTAYAGALPPKTCSRHKGGYPDFPEKFERPDTSIISIEKKKR